ncbi:MAG: FxsA family protein [Porticoccaceae bacterium]
MPLPLLLFILVPALEIAVLIQVGGWLGASWTLVLILATAMLGYRLLRIQGFETLWRGQQKLARGELPAQELVEGVMLALCGALLLTPGFITDIIGFAGLVPAWRQAVGRRVIARGMATNSQSRSAGPQVFEGEYEEPRERLDR